MNKKNKQNKSTTNKKAQNKTTSKVAAATKVNPLKKLAQKVGNPIKPIQNFFANRSKGFQFLTLFVLCMGLFYVFYYSDFYIKNINAYVVGFQAKVGALLLNIFGQNAKAIGSSLNGKAFSMSVAGGCDGMEVMALLISGIIATPLPWKYKWKGILVGGGVLAALNILRLPLLYWAGGFVSMELFDFLHVQGGFVIFVFISILILLKWLSWANGQTIKDNNDNNDGGESGESAGGAAEESPVLA